MPRRKLESCARGSNRLRPYELHAEALVLRAASALDHQEILSARVGGHRAGRGGYPYCVRYSPLPKTSIKPHTGNHLLPLYRAPEPATSSVATLISFSVSSISHDGSLVPSGLGNRRLVQASNPHECTQ